MNFFKFRYRANVDLLNRFGCLALPVFIAFVVIKILQILGIASKLPDFVMQTLLIASICIGVLWLIIYSVSDKGVLLTNDYIKIKRYSITTYHWIPNFKIKYMDIKSINSSKGAIPLRRSYKARHQLVGGGDLSYYAEIILNNGKQYEIPVENQEEFVVEVRRRINIYREFYGLEKLN